MRIGVLALQGDFSAHARALETLGYEVRLARRPSDLDLVEGLVLPGGESTTQLRLLASARLESPIVALPVDTFVAMGRAFESGSDSAVTLYAAGRSPFTEDQGRLLEMIAPHVAQALQAAVERPAVNAGQPAQQAAGQQAAAAAAAAPHGRDLKLVRTSRAG